jgi:DNA-binding transcriptional MerR regulator
MQHAYTPRFTRDELVEATGVSARTIRFYVEKGLAPPAHGRGKSAYYTSEHVEILTKIRELRARNLSTEEIRQELEKASGPPAQEPAGETWSRVALHPDLEIHTREGAPEHIRVLSKQIQRLAAEWLGDTSGN